MADAQPQFKEQAEAVALDEAQALDNAALYSQLRGDNGGIGMSQFGAAGYIAKEGWSYQQVLAHYYPGTTLATVD